MDKNRKYCIIFLIEFIVLLIIISSFTIIVDPFFHYHKPLKNLHYSINNQRYQNDGIVKNFDYNALITGTSMTENFKTSEIDKLFNVKSIKVSYSGGTFKETNDNLKIALKKNKNMKIVLRGIYYQYLFSDKNLLHEQQENYPTYLYDDKLYNDVKYFLNKDVLFNNTIETIKYTLNGNKTTSFDEYSNWSSLFNYGKEKLDSDYDRPPKTKTENHLNQAEIFTLKENINQNLLQIIKDNPDVEFYYFYSPCSIYFWDYMNRFGKLEKYMEAESFSTKMLLEYKNVHVFSFLENIDMISNLDNYKDMEHYGEWINSDILKWMKNREYELTKENYLSHLNTIKNIYLNYNYEQYFDNNNNK